MKNIVHKIVCVAMIAATFSFIGVTSTSALPADVERGDGCFVGWGENEYFFDETCQAQAVTKIDNEGNLQFYTYQDHGQLPADYPLPTQVVRNTFEACGNFGGSIGIKCGIIDELVTPTGEYKSSWMIRGE